MGVNVLNKKTISINAQGGGTSLQRKSNIELFRIITMLAIVAHHYVVNSGLTATDGPIYADPLSGASIFLLLFGAWGKIGINCFVMITGYFMCKSRITVRKFIKLIFEVMFYKILIQAIFWISGYAPMTIESLIQTILPVTEIGQNFTGTYLVFFLCIPFLNTLIQNLKERQHIYLVLLSCFVYVFFGTVKILPVTMNYVSWYAVLYLIASYVRLYPKKIFGNKRIWGWMTVTALLMCIASIIACTWLGTVLNRAMAYFFVTDSNTFLALFTGISAFMFFLNIEMRYSKFINTISASTFGVLLIHANSDSMRQWLWKDVLDNVGFYDSPWLLVHAFGSVVGIFFVCVVIDLLRIRFVERPFFRWWDKNWEKIEGRYKRWERKVCERWGIGE